jgi:hypothetical protein
MRTLVRSLQALGLALLVALAAGAVVSADSSSFRQSGYGGTGPSGTTGPTATPTVVPTATPTPTVTPSSRPKVKLTLVKKGSSRKKGIKARVSLDRKGRVTLNARKGRKKVGSRAINFSAAGVKTTRVKPKKLEKVPARVTVSAQGRDTSGRSSKVVRKAIRLKR